ncbi:UNVERIFIED_CONTAM: SH3 domain-containing protein, partial [Kocuria sp. CPCC 205274]
NPVETVYMPPQFAPSQGGTVTQPAQVNNNRIPEVAWFTVGVDSLNIRRKPSLKGEIVQQYNRGQSFKYDSKMDAEGYRWVHYIGQSGLDCWVAVRDLKTNKLFGTIK